MKVPDTLIQILKEEDRFLIASHVNPEGDAVGSALALAEALWQMGKTAKVFLKDGVPEVYEFLPDREVVETTLDKNFLEDAVFVLVDCNEPKRTGLEDQDIVTDKTVVIDHHETRKDFGRIKWIEPESPATGMMIYYLLKALGVEFSKEIATNLYVAIAVDTGTFRYDNTTSETLRVAAELIDLGVKPGEVAQKIYESWPTNRFQLLCEMLNTLEIERNGSVSVAITTITEDMFRKTGTGVEDTDDFSNFARMLRDVDVSVMLRQDGPNKWKGSMRGKGKVNLAEVAKALGGGGHRDAAGFNVEGTLEEVKERLKEALKKAAIK
ncbi:MAG: bifunctional oligoribonuclease/PAP phosphatase NrnA [Nitrospirae bacterium]|nr:MAG: bifunctional oligoribonuclease/PAP phosphatase NrnA [Nitrospirota bacterium]